MIEISPTPLFHDGREQFPPQQSSLPILLVLIQQPTEHMTTGRSATHPWRVLGLVVASTVLGLAGTDLVLPAIPSLPEALGGDATRAQLVLAAYAAGTCIGLIAYGALGDRFTTHKLFVASLFSTAAISFACSAASNVNTLVLLRAVQGAASAGPAVFAPGIIKSLFDETRAVRALGILGSIEALAPAFAPIFGIWLVSLGGWRASFETIGALAFLVAAVTSASGLVPQTARRRQGAYTRLLSDPVFLRYALSQALVLGGLLTFVFGMPAIFVRALGGSVTNFIAMQICGVVTFTIVANLVGSIVARFGVERVIEFGTLLAAVGAAAMLGYALLRGTNAVTITLLFVLVTTGLGLRGPPGFYRAVLAAQGDDARGSALVMLATLGVAATGTTVAAPFIERGLVPLAAVTLTLHSAAFICLAALPRFEKRET